MLLRELCTQRVKNKGWFAFYVPVRCAKFTSQAQLESDSPIMAHQQHNNNSCCFSIIASDFKPSNKFPAENKIAIRIYSSLTSTILDKFEFANPIITDKARK